MTHFLNKSCGGGSHTAVDCASHNCRFDKFNEIGELEEIDELAKFGKLGRSV